MQGNAYIIGAGFAGATCARKLAEAGFAVQLVERRSQVGGNSCDSMHESGVQVQNYGPHIFHANDERVWGFLSQFGSWRPYAHKVRGYVSNTLVPIPFNFESIDLLFSESEAADLKTLLLTLFEEDSRVPVGELLASKNERVSAFGDYIFEHVFRHYTAKQWGIKAEDVKPSILSRVPVIIGYGDGYFTDAYQFMPEQGFTQLISDILDHPNIELRLDVDARDELDFSKPGTIKVAGEDWGGHVIFTGPLDELFNYEFGQLPYRSIKFDIEVLAQDRFQHHAVVNYPETESFTRITEFKYLTRQDIPGKTAILREYPCDFAEGLERCYPIESVESQALYTLYREKLASIPNLYACGRLAEYKYLNMDGAAACALRLAEEIAGDVSE